MYHTEMHPITFYVIIVECFFLFYFLIESLRKPNLKSVKRFSYFTIYLIVYNTSSGLFPDKNIPIPLLFQHIFSYAVGLFLALYYVKYIYDEFNIKNYKLLTVHNLILSLGSSFIFLFVIPLIVTGNLLLSKHLFIYIPILISLIFIYKIAQSFYALILGKGKRINKYYKNRIIGAFIALISIVLLPVVVSLGDFQVIELFVVNTGYFILTVILIQDIIHETRKSSEFLRKMGYSNDIEPEKNISIIKRFNEFGFTNREVEIANYILEDYSFKEIGNTLFISEGTVSKHASNIYKKCGTISRNEFLNLFDH